MSLVKHPWATVFDTSDNALIQDFLVPSSDVPPLLLLKAIHSGGDSVVSMGMRWSQLRQGTEKKQEL
mgnify:CR=1 FL=1